MKKISYIITTLTILLLFTNCNSSKQDNNKTVHKSEQKVSNSGFQRVEEQKNKPVILKSRKKIEEDKDELKILNKMGIDKTNDGKIVIEPKKTKEFLNSITKVFESEAKKIKDKNKDLKAEDLGIQMSKDKIIINPKKTEDFLDNLSKDLENIANELDKTIKE